MDEELIEDDDQLGEVSLPSVHKKTENVDAQVPAPTINHSSSLINDLIKSATPEELTILRKKAIDARLDFEIKGFEKQRDHELSYRDIDKHVESHQKMKDKTEGGLEGFSVNSEIKTASGSMHIKSNKGVRWCFVATTVYGSSNHQDVIELRKFRERRLKTWQIGRAFIKWYYRNGPNISKVIEQIPILKRLIRFILSSAIKLLKFL